MQKTPIDWCDWSSNPEKGCQGPVVNGKHQPCEWCYAADNYARFHPDRDFRVPQFFPKELVKMEKVLSREKSTQLVFLDSMGDLYDEAVYPIWRHQIYVVCSRLPEHIFLVLTKQPENMTGSIPPTNVWLGVSVTSLEDRHRIETLKCANRVSKKFISFEPLLGCVGKHATLTELLCGIDWVIIGGLAGRKKLLPKPKWVYEIASACADNEIPMFFKNNMVGYDDSESRRLWCRDYPAPIKRR